MTLPPDPSAAHPLPAAIVNQQQSGGMDLDAYNRIEQVGDLVAGDKVTIVVYTGPAARRRGALLAGAGLSQRGRGTLCDLAHSLRAAGHPGRWSSYDRRYTTHVHIL
jgi:hypothetical protein